MEEHLLSLSEQIYNIKDKIKDNEYLQIMNTLKDMYALQKENYCGYCIEGNDSEVTDEDYISQEIDYETDIVYSNMFQEYTCECNIETYECLCYTSFNLFRYCKNYQKIVSSCQNLQYIMNLYFPDINNEYKIEFAKIINIDINRNSINEFMEITKFLFNLIRIYSNYTKKCLILITCNFIMENVHHIINIPEFKFNLYDKINEIIVYDSNCYIDTFSDILIENNENIELLHNWLSIIKPYISTLNED